MPLEQIPYLLNPTVHPLCISGHHEMCKKYEEWNYKAKFPCACTECNHPKPEATEEMKEIARRARARDQSTDSPKRGLDYAAMLEVSSDGTQQEPDSPEVEGEPETQDDTKEAAVAASKKSEEKDTKTKTSDRRERGALEESVKEITDRYEDGKIDLPEGKTLTPHTIAQLIKENEGLENAPSTGAVNAVLKRWDENYGFALTHDKPYAFKRYSAAGKKKGLDALKEAHREKRKAERAAEKESSAA